MERIESFSMSAIGFVRCPGLQTKDDYQSKKKNQTFPAELILKPDLADALDEIETFDHAWLIWFFDRNLGRGYETKVFPRPDPSRRRGLFTTRSPNRPNPIGLTCVKVSGREGPILKFENPDILDDTPVLDIKPYIPSSDSRPDSKAGWLDELAR